MKIIHAFLALSVCVLFFSCRKESKIIEEKPIVETESPTDGIFLAIKENTDFIRTLPFLGPAIKLDTYDGSNQTTHPSVLYFPNKWNKWKFWMVHTPYPFSKDFHENPSIAVSNNGINWTTPNGLENPLDRCGKKENQNRYHFSDGALLYREDLKQIECWYRYSKNGVLEEIWRRTSKDGKVWTKKELMISTNGNPTNMLMSPALLYEEGKYKMWSVTSDPYRVEYREALDGKNWTKPTIIKIPLPKNIEPWHVEVKKIDNGYEMLLNVFNTKNKDPHKKFIMSSSSQDGTNWEEFKNSILPSGKVDKWNGKMIYRSSFIKIDKLYIVYYSAMASDYSWGVGIAMGDRLDNLTY